MHTSPGGPLTVQCFTDATEDETYGPWIDVRGYPNVVFYLTGAGTISGGVITFEEAAPKDARVLPNQVAGESAGTYSAITTKNAADVTGGAQVAVHLTPAAYCFVRARISTVLSGAAGVISCCCVAY